MESIWEKSFERPSFIALDGDKNTDVLIIGGGIAGLLCAYKLGREGVYCALLEADRICGGVTDSTTAKITLGHGLIYDKIIKHYGEDKAKLYLQAQLEAGEEYERLCQKIDCDYEKVDSYVYSQNDRAKIKGEVNALCRLGVEAEFSDSADLPIWVEGAVKIKNQSQFNPLKFLLEISKDLPVFEHTKVLKFLPHKVITNRGTVTFKRLIIATHFPILNKHGLYALKLYQHRSYLLAIKGAKQPNGMYVDGCDKGLSFRNYGDILLLGGGGHRTGKKGGCWQELEAFAAKYYKNSEIVAKWATQDCMTLDGIPYIGQYSKNTRDIYVATGFNKWGMTNAMVASNILTDQITGKVNPYAEVFSPSRSILHPQLAINIFDSAVGLLTPTVPRCPHLGCALKYNHSEHSWDCPCHGSRFAENGNLINNPATDDLKLIKNE